MRNQASKANWAQYRVVTDVLPDPRSEYPGTIVQDANGQHWQAMPIQLTALEAGSRRNQRTKLPVYSLHWVPVYEVSRQRLRALRVAAAASALSLIVPPLLFPLFDLFLPVWAALGVVAVLGYLAWRMFKRCGASLYSSFPEGKFRDGDLIFPDRSLLELDPTCTRRGRTEFWAVHDAVCGALPRSYWGEPKELTSQSESSSARCSCTV